MSDLANFLAWVTLENLRPYNWCGYVGYLRYLGPTAGTAVIRARVTTT